MYYPRLTLILNQSSEHTFDFCDCEHLSFSVHSGCQIDVWLSLDVTNPFDKNLTNFAFVNPRYLLTYQQSKLHYSLGHKYFRRTFKTGN